MNKAFYFCGQVIPDSLLEKHFDRLKGCFSPAGNTFYNALLDGICENGCGVYTAVALPKELLDVCRAEYSGCWHIFWGTKSNSFVLRAIKNFFAAFNSIRTFRRKEAESEKYVVFNVLRLGSVIGGLLACKLLGLNSIGVVTDVPGYRIKTEKKESLFRRACDRLAQMLLGSFDSYVLLSEAMAQVMPVKHKPYTVIEGMYKGGDEPACGSTDKYGDFTVLYAGSLHSKYGIMSLVDAVRGIENSGMRLLIYGSGEAEDRIRSASEEDSRICFGGSISHREILCEERRASLLVNPRPVDDEYVKYSFPSKNMEYMASGTPVLLTDIPSLPEEYKQYVFLAEDGSAESLRREIEALADKEAYESALARAGSARNFILENKTSAIQAGKLIEFLDR